MKGISSIAAALALCAASPVAAGHVRDVGLVLSSGGCKGAYHLGVWRALAEAGIADRVGVISGTSVGALCSALFASVKDPARQEEVWKGTLSVFRLQPDRAEVERIYAREAEGKRKWYGVDRLSSKLEEQLRAAAEAQARREMMPKIASACRELEADPDTTNLTFGALSAERLHANIDSVLPNPLPGDFPVVYAAALKCGKGGGLKYFCLNAIDRKTQIDALCASAAMPVAFPPVEIGGSLWQDGGWTLRGGDPTPIDPILKNHKEVKTVVVVHLHDDKSLPSGYRREMRRKADEANVRLVEIVPSRNIGGPLGGWFGVFDSSSDTMNELVEAGHSDAKKALRGTALP